MKRRFAAGLAVTGLLGGLALVSLVWTPEPPARIHIALKLRPPLAPGLPAGLGLLGTDNFGRDVLSRLMAGAWNSLAVAAPAVALGAAGGTVLGIAAAGRRGLVDALAMRFRTLTLPKDPGCPACSAAVERLPI